MVPQLGDPHTTVPKTQAAGHAFAASPSVSEERSLHVAWLGPVPTEEGGVAGVATELLDGLSSIGHRIDCFFTCDERPIPPRLTARPNITYSWGSTAWRWDRWYSRNRTAAFISGLLVRAAASVVVRRQIATHHRRDPYDLVYQFSSIESLGTSRRFARLVPLVIHPETHSAGELRSLISERKLARRCDSTPRLVLIAAVLLLRALVQRVYARRARLLICISAAFRDHLVRDYGIEQRRTVVVPNPVRLDRFDPAHRDLAERPVVLALGRVAVRKGIQDVVGVAQALHNRNSPITVRIVGAGSLWSDYTALLSDLPATGAEYAGAVSWADVTAELAGCDVLLAASRYEPFALTVAEALASGVPTVGTTAVGAMEQVDGAVAVAVAPGDVDALVTAVVSTVDRVRTDPAAVAAAARSEAERLFATETVCAQISRALLELAC